MSAPDTDGLVVRLQQTQPFALDVYFRCDNGELLALTGPSGSGKTSVLRAIAGLRSATHGEITCQGSTWFNSQQGVRHSPQHRRVGFTFQQYALIPHFTVTENITMAMSHVPGNERTEKAHHWLAMTNMSGLQDRKPRTLSGGQQQRVALARALAREPDVLLLDEPFSAVDQMTRDKLYRELAQIRRALDIPIVLVTHDMNEVQQLADSICLMHHGKSMQTGKVSTVFRQPANARNARLLGHKNVYPATLHRREQQHELELFGQRITLQEPVTHKPGPVDVFISPAAIVLHRSDKPSMGERENPLTTVVAETVEFGDDVSLRLRINGTSNDVLGFRVSRHVVNRNRIIVGSTATVSILSEGIHVMPKTNADVT